MKIFIPFLIILLIIILSQKLNRDLIKTHLKIENYANDNSDKTATIPQVKWNPLATEQWKLLYKKFGPPSSLDPSEHGLALWKNTDLKKKGYCWERLFIHDFRVNSIYLWVKADFKNNLRGQSSTQNIINNVQKLNKSIEYDPVYNLIKVTASNLDNAISLLIVSSQMIRDNLSLEKGKQLLLNLNKNPSQINSLSQKLCYELSVTNEKQKNI